MAISPGTSAVQVRQLTREFGLKKALDAVSFDIPRGAVVALIGPNGAGKSTLLRIASALLLPTRGDVLIEGCSVVNNPREVHTRIGFLPDFFGLYDDLTVSEYLETFCRAYRIGPQQRGGVIRRVLEQSGLMHQAQEPIKHLSRGMRQRVGIARALVPDPPVLFLDEPTSGVDPDLRTHLQNLFKDLAARGKTLIVSSHLLQELEDYCSHVAILYQARLMVFGTLDEVRQRVRPGRWVVLRSTAAAARVMEVLSVIPEVKQLVKEGDSFRFSCDGSEESLAGVLKALVNAGVSVTQFSEEKKSIHEAYIHTLQGKPRS